MEGAARRLVTVFHWQQPPTSLLAHALPDRQAQLPLWRLAPPPPGGSHDDGPSLLVGGRALTDERNRRLKAAGPATPVEVLGLNEMPEAGDLFYVVQNQRKAQEVAESRVKPKGPVGSKGPMSLDQLQKLMQSGDVKPLALKIASCQNGYYSSN